MPERVQGAPVEGLRVSLDTRYTRWLFLIYIPSFAVMMRGSLGSVLFGAFLGAVAYGWSIWVFTTPYVDILPDCLRVLEDGKVRTITFASIQEVRETRWRSHTSISVTFDVSKSLCQKIQFISWLPANWPFDGRSVAQHLRILSGLRAE